jgi:NAD(P)H dehydrogenase (quinone)
MLRPLLRGTLAYVGLGVLPPFAAYHVPYIDAAARQQLLHDYRGHLANLDHLALLEMPALADFDRNLHPLHSEVPA